MNQPNTQSSRHLHTDHIGSLLRPPSLIDAFKQFARNEPRPDFFEASQDADIDHHEAESHRETLCLVEALMGRKTELRLEFIRERAKFVEEVDV